MDEKKPRAHPGKRPRRPRPPRGHEAGPLAITGASGFLGLNLLRRVLESDPDRIELSRLTFRLIHLADILAVTTSE